MTGEHELNLWGTFNIFNEWEPTALNVSWQLAPPYRRFLTAVRRALLWADVLKREVYLISAEEERVPGPLIKRDVVPLPVIAYRNSKEEANVWQRVRRALLFSLHMQDVLYCIKWPSAVFFFSFFFLFFFYKPVFFFFQFSIIINEHKTSMVLGSMVSLNKRLGWNEINKGVIFK